ncbi:bacillithiol biosynthesis cysteine-adding enzyme BshC [Evansella vedderi]|uniref:Putative cysteine ligase BshC n=1 Tax=Evansella vedderi TaxID=38282 RepID=A0ABT9ZSV8_9BACI|nr:bacillithiol biosynthesis cysteine-adding enzyme BshC [Evansella vedderi]MDQ0253827.1 bacillithiol biosynthesis cysteine-adding enzyme BshC [Evansella vedderi]
MKMVLEDHLKNQPFLQQYINNNDKVMEFFDYPVNDEGLLRRYKEVRNRSYQRSELIKSLISFNKRFTDSPATYSQIARLEDKNSVVVVGGQQAGLLTGPVYTINKIFSILHEAKAIENKLNIPVVPIFWIAGEDHDVDEINHIYLHRGQRSRKFNLRERNDIKRPASDRIISAEKGRAFIKEAFQYLQETPFTKDLYLTLLEDVKEDCTYVEWFATIIHRLFNGTGLVLMDAHDQGIREIERPYFKEMVTNNDRLRSAFYEGAKGFQEAGFGEPIEIDEKNAHLFIHDQGQRFLLEKEGMFFKEKNGANKWMEEEILQKLNQNSLQLSNNVVTRPVMQDKLLPVITFIAGPGELKYWGTLRRVFHTLQINMPLILPRVHLTFISRRIEKNLAWIGMEASEVSKAALTEQKELWLDANTPSNMEGAFERARKELEATTEKLAYSFPTLGKGASAVHSKYEAILKKGLIQYEKQLSSFILHENKTALNKYDEVEVELIPDGNLQERYINIYSFLNLYGDDLVTRVYNQLKEEDTLLGKHVYIYL